MIAIGSGGMSRELRFRFNLEKFANALAYFASKGVKGLTTLKAVKLLYLADRAHFLQHGRPITGDRYIAMDLGPVPEDSYQLITRLVAKDEIDDEVKRWLAERLSVYRGVWGTLAHPQLKSKHEPDLEVFSDSDIEALDTTIQQYGSYQARDLVDLTHEHQAYKLADRGRPKGSSVELPYEFFFADADVPNMRQFVEEQQEDRDFVEALRNAGRAALRKQNMTATH
jgi:uncharacterized phage-associated protein